ncbi:shikimate dehydrogenase [Isoptericola sp. NPDC019482]|uniref:shikimate dehydrogenase n=1 Tax=Isoptericola sp. NPDC019482 TaxID=3154688 RepID=UPI003491932C
MSASFLVALLGDGIGPSLSPALHMEEARRLGLRYDYRIVDLAGRADVDLADELRRLEEAGFDAANVTHPYKQAVVEHATRLSPTVRRLGSANLVLLGQDGRTAHNTDCSGFRTALGRFLADGRPGRVAGRTVLQVGAGGAGLATAAALVDMGVDRIVVHDVDPSATRALLGRFGGTSGPAHGRLLDGGGSLHGWLPRADGVVHVTPVGMAAHPGVAFDVDLLRPDAWVAEVVYRPLETELVRRARARGLATLDGGAMAVAQAADSLRLITGRDPDEPRMRAHFARLVAT